MMSFARAIGEFGATLMVAGYIPNKTNTLPLEIYFLVEQGKENQAWLWVLVLIAFAVSVIGALNLMNSHVIEGLMLHCFITSVTIKQNSN